jgi:RNA polymerase sigma-70 factor (ECF subfamily)
MAPPTPAPGLDDTSLVAALRAGDDRTYEVFVRRHCGPMLAVAGRILRNEEDARDALQDAFLSVFKEIERFDGRSRLTSWLHRIVINAALMRLRRRRHAEKSIEELLPHFGDEEHQIDPPAPWMDLPLAGLQRQELCDRVRKAIDQLPETYRTILMLRDIEGLAMEETARLLDSSIGVVNTLAPHTPGPAHAPRSAPAERRPVNCREFTEFLHEYLFGNLPDDERLVFEAHPEECPWCVAYLDSYRNTLLLEASAFLPAQEPIPGDVPEELVQAILNFRPRA